jgi:hypothetical protein
MTKIADKLDKVNDTFTINRYDNGFMIEVGGRNAEGDWANSKVLCTDLEALIDLVKEAISLPLDN